MLSIMIFTKIPKLDRVAIIITEYKLLIKSVCKKQNSKIVEIKLSKEKKFIVTCQ